MGISSNYIKITNLNNKIWIVNTGMVTGLTIGKPLTKVKLKVLKIVGEMRQ